MKQWAVPCSFPSHGENRKRSPSTDRLSISGANQLTYGLLKFRFGVEKKRKIKDTHNFRRADFIDRHNDYTRLIHNKRTL